MYASVATPKTIAGISRPNQVVAQTLMWRGETNGFVKSITPTLPTGGEMSDALNPSATLLVKLGSALVHAAELSDPKGHHFDKAAFDQCLQDAEVVQWLEAMNAMALLPVRRDTPRKRAKK